MKAYVNFTKSEFNKKEWSVDEKDILQMKSPHQDRCGRGLFKPYFIFDPLNQLFLLYHLFPMQWLFFQYD
ncbi:hypothetical protein [Pseudogracilibacillus auburnensis]|uniref:hypothetical protein n=1 Tax=Pseudogracilibacillus auburnensis TaxID=1494959 RepID=UPI001A97AC74|nr:hypothetical protein [Pseudogracilibacillus auburnensis]MBO1003176.1 hypothetical protein [Pseudogracilibacillus auburnensis]